jgi:hypothetical protein
VEKDLKYGKWIYVTPPLRGRGTDGSHGSSRRDALMPQTKGGVAMQEVHLWVAGPMWIGESIWSASIPIGSNMIQHLVWLNLVIQ